MKDIIIKELSGIENCENIKILYACESGSRAWGFPSLDSDYDVRFIYIRPLDWYLSIDEQKDTLDFPINDVLDINGWDIRKALKLFRASNAVIYEWLQSPIIYKEENDFSRKLLQFSAENFSLKAAMHHYLGMTSNPFKNDLQSEEVKAKKYLYAIRSALACRWMRFNQSLPPMELGKLCGVLESNNPLIEIIVGLVEKKKELNEKEMIPKINELNKFIQVEIEEGEKFAAVMEKNLGNTETLNNFFRHWLNEK